MSTDKRIINKRARFEYQILDTYEAGMVLTGPEVKSIRTGRATLQDSFVAISGSQAFAININIHKYEFSRDEEYDPTHRRTLLLHKKQILELSNKIEGTGLTLIPLEIINRNNRYKLLFGLAKGKKSYDKRETIKRRDIDRDLKADLKLAHRR